MKSSLKQLVKLQHRIKVTSLKVNQILCPQSENTFLTWLYRTACCPAAAATLWLMCIFLFCQHLPFQLRLHQVLSWPILLLCSGKILVRFARASDLLRCSNLNNLITSKLNMHLKENFHQTRRFTGCEGVVGVQLIWVRNSLWPGGDK